MTTESELLYQYAREGHEAAFTEIVQRQADLVYGTAWRITSDTSLAQEVTQSVFTLVAQNAERLARHPTLVGWLYTTTRHQALDAVRAEKRRRTRELEASQMQNETSVPEPSWTQLRPLLDEAMGQLRERHRTALLLRFFKGCTHEEVGVALGMSENSAQKCVERALEKLRGHFARRGVTTTAALLGSALAASAAQTAPAGLAAQVAGASLEGLEGATLSGSTFFLIMSTKIKIMLAAAAALLIVGFVVLEVTHPSASSTPAAASPVHVSTPAKPAVALPVITAPATTENVRTDAKNTPGMAKAPVAIPLNAANAQAIFAQLKQLFVNVYTNLMDKNDPQAALQSLLTLEAQVDLLRTKVKGTPLEQPVAQATQALVESREAIQRGDVPGAKKAVETLNQIGLLIEQSLSQAALADSMGGLPASAHPGVVTDPVTVAKQYALVKLAIEDASATLYVKNDPKAAADKLNALEPQLNTLLAGVKNTPMENIVVEGQVALQNARNALMRGDTATAAKYLTTVNDLSIQLENMMYSTVR